MFKSFMQDDRGGISAEYVAILALVVLVSIGALQNLGGIIERVVRGVTTELETVPGLPPAPPDDLN